MARVLVVGDAARAAEIESSGHVVEAGEGIDPARLVTLTPRLEGVSVVCWLFGRFGTQALHRETLAALLEYLVDTPVRGLVYERSDAHPGGAEIVERARTTFRIRSAVIAPGDDLAAAVATVLAA